MKNRQLSCQNKKATGFESTKRPWKKANNDSNYYDSRLESFRALGDSVHSSDQDPRGEQRIGRFLKEENNLLLNQLSAKDSIIYKLHSEIDEKASQFSDLTKSSSFIKNKLRKSEDLIVQLTHELEKRNLRISYIEEKLKCSRFLDNPMKPSRDLESVNFDKKSAFIEELSGEIEKHKKEKEKLEKRLSDVYCEVEFYKSDNSKLQGAYQELLGELAFQEAIKQDAENNAQSLNRCLNFMEQAHEALKNTGESVIHELESYALKETNETMRRCFIDYLNILQLSPLMCQKMNSSDSYSNREINKVSSLGNSALVDMENYIICISEEIDEVANLVGLPLSLRTDKSCHKEMFIMIKEQFRHLKSIENALAQPAKIDVLQKSSINYQEAALQTSFVAEEITLGEENKLLKQKIAVLMQLQDISLNRSAQRFSSHNESNGNLCMLKDIQEEGDVSLKNDIDKEGELTMDQREQLEELIQKLVDNHTKKLEEISQAHEALIKEKDTLSDEVKDLRIKNQILNLEKMQIDVLKKELQSLQKNTSLAKKDSDCQVTIIEDCIKNKQKTIMNTFSFNIFSTFTQNSSSSFKLSNTQLRSSAFSVNIDVKDIDVSVQTSTVKDTRLDEWECERQLLRKEIGELKTTIQDMKVDFNKKSSCQFFQEESGVLVTEFGSRNTSESKIAAIEAQLVTHYEKQLAATQSKFSELEERISSLQLSLAEKKEMLEKTHEKLEEANYKLESSYKDKELLKEEYDRLNEYLAAVKGSLKNMKPENNQSLIEKTKNLELQTKLSQAEFDSQILRIRCNNLESEAASLREDLKLYKKERTQFLEKSEDILSHESSLRKECDLKTIKISTLLITIAMLKSELERLFLIKT